VSFDREPTLTCHGRDRLREDSWRPFKLGSKTGKYFKLFSLNNDDLGFFGSAVVMRGKYRALRGVKGASAITQYRLFTWLDYFWKISLKKFLKKGENNGASIFPDTNYEKIPITNMV
jgi:hypothetical protein